jgi:4-hydroxy-3-methylbut-2-enyl diphosphate reductase
MVIRVVVDTPDRPLVSPFTIPGGIKALMTLRRVGPALIAVSLKEVGH